MPKANIPTWQTILGEKLRKARKDRGYPLGKLAKALGVSRETVRLYETGETPPRLPALRIILQELDAAFSIDGTEISLSTLPPPSPPLEVREQGSFDFKSELVGVSVRIAVSKEGFEIRGRSAANGRK